MNNEGGYILSLVFNIIVLTTITNRLQSEQKYEFGGCYECQHGSHEDAQPDKIYSLIKHIA